MNRKQFRGSERTLGTVGPVLMSTLALNILALLMPLAMLLIFDRVIPYQSSETLTLLMMMLLVSAAFEFGLRWARSTILSSSAEKNAVSNHQIFLERVLNARSSTFGELPKVLHLERYAAISRLRNHYSGQNQALAIDLPFTVVFIAMVALIGKGLVLVPLGALLSIVVFTAVMKHAQRTIFDARKNLDNRRYAFLSEVLSNMPTVKANTMERQMERRFELLQEQTVNSSYRLILFSGFSQSYGAIFSQLSVAAMGLLGALFVIEGKIGIAELAACMMLNGRIIQPLMKLLTHWAQSDGIAIAKSKLADVDKMPFQPHRTGPTQAFNGTIEVSKLVMTPVGDDIGQDQERPQQAISFTLRPGEIAIIEAQKANDLTDLFAVIKGQCLPKAGRVLLDGYLAVDRISQRGRGGLVQLEQEPAIFSGTLLENISAFGSSAQVERAIQIAGLLRLEQRVNRLPLGYNTPLNVNGFFENDPINRHLVALVRAFSLEPRILLMNEPTATLDTPEREALSAFISGLEKRPTIIMASPDPRMSRLATQTIRVGHPLERSISEWLSDTEHDKADANRLSAA